MEWKQLSDEIFVVKEIFTDDYMDTIIDEFQWPYNHITFTKKENPNDPRFGELVDTSGLMDHIFNNDIGWNYKFMDASIYAKHAARKILKTDLKLVRIQSNIQFFGQESDWHTDYSDNDGPGAAWSFVIYINDDWDMTYDGQFVIATGHPEDPSHTKEYFNVSCIPNTGVLFNARLDHRGGAPNRFCNKHRMSLAFMFEEV
tara:strand:+ start:254 stop:856 length:603 start_codon:yes stop_codon:yes gene_type:complete